MWQARFRLTEFWFRTTNTNGFIIHESKLQNYHGAKSALTVPPPSPPPPKKKIPKKLRIPLNQYNTAAHKKCCCFSLGYLVSTGMHFKYTTVYRYAGLLRPCITLEFCPLLAAKIKCSSCYTILSFTCFFTVRIITPLPRALTLKLFHNFKHFSFLANTV